MKANANQQQQNVGENYCEAEKNAQTGNKNIKLQLVKTGDGRAPLRLSFAATTLQHTNASKYKRVCVCVAVMFAANNVLAGIKKQY